jgi:hypothetical protein
MTTTKLCFKMSGQRALRRNVDAAPADGVSRLVVTQAFASIAIPTSCCSCAG